MKTRTKKICLYFTISIVIGLVTYKLFNTYQGYRHVKMQLTPLVHSASREIHNITDVDSILMFLKSKNTNEISDAITTLRYSDGIADTQKVINSLLNIWNNDFPQFSEYDRENIGILIRTLKLQLAALLYKLDNDSDFINYIQDECRNKTQPNSQYACSLIEGMKVKLQNETLKNNEIDEIVNQLRDSILLSLKGELDHISHFNRMNAIASLGSIKFDTLKSINILLSKWSEYDCMSCSKEEICEKMNIAANLWRLGENKYTSIVYENCNNKSEDIRICGAIVLGLIDSKKSAVRLLKMLENDTVASVACAAALSLGDVGSVEMISQLNLAKKRKLGNLAEIINQSINKINQRESSSK